MIIYDFRWGNECPLMSKRPKSKCLDSAKMSLLMFNSHRFPITSTNLPNLAICMVHCSISVNKMSPCCLLQVNKNFGGSNCYSSGFCPSPQGDGWYRLIRSALKGTFIPRNQNEPNGENLEEKMSDKYSIIVGSNGSAIDEVKIKKNDFIDKNPNFSDK